MFDPPPQTLVVEFSGNTFRVHDKAAGDGAWTYGVERVETPIGAEAPLPAAHVARYDAGDRDKHIRDAAFKRGVRTAKLDAARRFFDEATFLKDAFDVWRNRAKSAEGKLKKALRLLRMTEHDLDEAYPLTAPAIGDYVGGDLGLATCLEERATMVEVHRENMTGFEKTARFMRDAAARLRSRHVEGGYSQEMRKQHLLDIAGFAEVCDRCDGCGWYEGGASIQTACEKCVGTGVAKAWPPITRTAPTRNALLTQVEIDAIAARLAKSRDTLAAMCEGRQRFTMSIPARPDHDPDLIFSETFNDLATLLPLVRAEATPTQSGEKPSMGADLAAIERVRALLDVRPGASWKATVHDLDNLSRALLADRAKVNP